jgi:hypothetical protein
VTPNSSFDVSNAPVNDGREGRAYADNSRHWFGIFSKVGTDWTGWRPVVPGQFRSFSIF